MQLGCEKDSNKERKQKMVVLSTIRGFLWATRANARPRNFYIGICATFGWFREEIQILEWHMGSHTPMCQTVYCSSDYAPSFQQSKSHTTSHMAVYQAEWLTQAPIQPGTWACGIPMALYKEHCNFILSIFFRKFRASVGPMVWRLGLLSQVGL